MTREDPRPASYRGAKFLVSPRPFKQAITVRANYPGSPNCSVTIELRGTSVEFLRGEGSQGGTLEVMPYEVRGLLSEDHRVRVATWNDGSVVIKVRGHVRTLASPAAFEAWLETFEEEERADPHGLGVVTHRLWRLIRDDPED